MPSNARRLRPAPTKKAGPERPDRPFRRIARRGSGVAGFAVDGDGVAAAAHRDAFADIRRVAVRGGRLDRGRGARAAADRGGVVVVEIDIEEAVVAAAIGLAGGLRRRRRPRRQRRRRIAVDPSELTTSGWLLQPARVRRAALAAAARRGRICICVSFAGAAYPVKIENRRAPRCGRPAFGQPRPRFDKGRRRG